MCASPLIVEVLDSADQLSAVQVGRKRKFNPGGRSAGVKCTNLQNRQVKETRYEVLMLPSPGGFTVLYDPEPDP